MICTGGALALGPGPPLLRHHEPAGRRVARRRATHATGRDVPSPRGGSFITRAALCRPAHEEMAEFRPLRKAVAHAIGPSAHVRPGRRAALARRSDDAHVAVPTARGARPRCPSRHLAFRFTHWRGRSHPTPNTMRSGKCDRPAVVPRCLDEGRGRAGIAETARIDLVAGPEPAVDGSETGRFATADIAPPPANAAIRWVAGRRSQPGTDSRAVVTRILSLRRSDKKRIAPQPALAPASVPARPRGEGISGGWRPGRFAMETAEPCRPER